MWCDSTVALHWLQKEVSQLKIFVANRVAKIKNSTKIKDWRHIRTDQNPADLISRGMDAAELWQNKLWWNGPKWLNKPQEFWPKAIQINSKELVEANTEIKTTLEVCSVQTSVNKGLQIYVKGYKFNEIVPIIEYTNDIQKLVRIISYVKRFCAKCKIGNNKTKQILDYSQIQLPSEGEKAQSLKYIVQLEQQKYYGREIKFLKHKDKGNMKFPEKSKIQNLRPIVDSEGILRVGGRICRAECANDMKNPIIIPNESKLCELLIQQTHVITKHGSIQIMMQVIRERYWIPQLRNKLRLFLHRCIVCALHNKKYETQLMSDLPADRVIRNRAFLITGVDYAGPIEMVEKYKRKTNMRKCWIAVFVCMVTRAIHLDLVTDLTSAAFIACFERFTCRRGHVNKLYSDNGTTL